MEKQDEERPLQHMRMMLGKKHQPPVFVTSSIALLLLAEKPAHGYALFREMCDMGVYDDSVDPAAVYPALKALEAESLVTAELVDEGSGPPRKVFHITKEGWRALEEFVELHLVVMASDIEYFHRRYLAIKKAREKTGSTVTGKEKAGSR